MTITGTNFSTPEQVLAYCNRCPYFDGYVATSAVLLAGGTANYVYRVGVELRRAPADVDDRDGGGASRKRLVLKFYPPFVRAAPNVPLEQGRYFAEKEALLLLEELDAARDAAAAAAAGGDGGGGNSGDKDDDDDAGITVRAPRLLHADDASHVLLLEDAGSGLRSLFDVLSAVGGRAAPPSPQDPAPSPAALARAVARRLASLARHPLSEHRRNEVFVNASARDAVRGYIFGDARRRAVSLGVESEYGAWLGRLERAATAGASAAVSEGKQGEGKQEEEEEGGRPVAVLTMGDCWPNSLFLAREEEEEEEQEAAAAAGGDDGGGARPAPPPKQATAWLLDWELARLQRPLADAQQMAANLWLMERLPEKYDARATAAFRRELLRAAADEFSGQRTDCEDGKELFLAYVLLILVDVHEPCWGDFAGDKKGVALLALQEVDRVLALP